MNLPAADNCPHGTARGAHARGMFAVIVCAVIACVARASSADNAAFALAPRDAVIAIDARGATDVLGLGGDAMRPVLEALAGERALATFDLLAKRNKQEADEAVREVFAGRAVFYMLESGAEGGSWMFGVQADDARCERVLKLLGARMVGPGRFASGPERLLLRRAGGWLLLAPQESGDQALDEASARAAVEDPARSLLGEPLIQDFLAHDAPVRIFMRHGAPLGGASMIGLSRENKAIRAEVWGSYDSSPLGPPVAPAPLEAQLVSKFEGSAAAVLASPSNGIGGAFDAFWLALVPELSPSAAMRDNLVGERLIVIGPSADRSRPAIALAWSVEDAEQSSADQDAFMRGVCCGLLRAADAASSRLATTTRVGSGSAPQGGGAEAAPSAENGVTANAPRSTLAVDPNHSAGKSCEALGPFMDRYFGPSFKLGDAQLCWGTVATKCGGWQVYATDAQWLVRVSDELLKGSCGADERQQAVGVGFCDGPRIASIIRRWRPLVTDDSKPSQRISRGLDAIASVVEGLGLTRFRYEIPGTNRVRATLVLGVRASTQPAPESAGSSAETREAASR